MIDAHTHIYWGSERLRALLDAWSLRVVAVHITGEGFFETSMEERWSAMRALKDRFPDRVILCTTFDATSIADEAFAPRTLGQLERHLNEGAAMVKVWKDVGLGVRDADGSLVQVDDPRLEPIWAWLADRNVPVLSHIGEPKAAWQPLDPASPHYRFYADHPEHHLLGRSDVPSWKALMDARDRWLAAHPELVVIGAHMGSMAHDVREVARRLDEYPNFFVDTAERFDDLYVQDHASVRTFFEQYHNRVLYGSDVIMASPETVQPDAYEALLHGHMAYLGTNKELTAMDTLDEPVETHGLGLSATAMHNILENNAARLLDLAHRNPIVSPSRHPDHGSSEDPRRSR